MKIFFLLFVVLFCSCSSTKPPPDYPPNNINNEIIKLQTDIKNLLAQISALKVEVAKKDTFWILDDDIGIGTRLRPLSTQKIKEQIQAANTNIVNIKASIVAIQKRLTDLEARLPLRSKRRTP